MKIDKTIRNLDVRANKKFNTLARKAGMEHGPFLEMLLGIRKPYEV